MSSGINPLFAQLALDWLDAEREANPKEWPIDRPTRDEMTVAIDRVYQVISGNVTWDKASPGDRAVWKSRVEAIPLFARSWRKDGTPNRDPNALDELIAMAVPAPGEFNQPPPTNYTGQFGPNAFNNPPTTFTNEDGVEEPIALGPEGEPIDFDGGVAVGEYQGLAAGDGYRQRLWWTFYDTWPGISANNPPPFPAPHAGYVCKLFDQPQHIGNRWLTNLEVGGALPNDETFVVLSVYVAISSIEALHWAADNIAIELWIGDRPALPNLFVRDLFRGVELVTPKRRPLVIPIQQSFHANASIRRLPPKELPPFDLTFHIEGLRTRDIA